MKKYIPIGILTLSLVLAIITRFYKLGQAPAGLYLDEAAQGYNAYSILLTGKDEFGKLLPVVFRSFTDFKTPVYIYLITPLIPIFGLTKFTVRFPSFFFSILTLPVLYLLIRKVSPKKYSVSLPLILTFLLSISPWHILFGRTNFECNVALFFLITGIYLFYLGLTNPKKLILSAIFFAIAIPAYHAQRIVTPLVMIALFVKYKSRLLSPSHRNFVMVGILLGFLILLPTLSVALTPGFLARATGLNIFSQSRLLAAGYLTGYDGLFAPLINSGWFLTTREFLALYLSYFSPRNMFILGDYGPRSSFPSLSTFFIWQFPFYIFGLISFIKSKDLKELKFLTLILFFISPIPAAVTRDPYSTIRSLQMVIPLLIIISFGILKIYTLCKRLIVPQLTNLHTFNLVTVIVCIITVTYSLGRLYSSVIILNEYYRAAEWNYGFEQVTDDIKKMDPDLPVIVDNARTEPYSQLLFFLKFDPETYQKDNYEVPLNEYYTNMNRNKTKIIGKVITRPIDWKPDISKEQYLIGDSLAISDDQIKTNHLTLLDKVRYPDGSVAFVVVKTNPVYSD